MPDTAPLAVNYEDVIRAAQNLAGVAHCTPVLTSAEADRCSRATVFFKCENFQHVGAFKFRGAYNAICSLNDAQKKRGVVAFSSGNHAQGIALAARMLGVKATVVMPEDAPSIKLDAVRRYGAEVFFYRPGHDDREILAAEIADKQRAVLIPSSDYPEVIAGQATAAKELIEAVGPLDYLFVSVGGGGLLSGSGITAAHLSPQCQVIGVEPEAGNDAQQSLRAGKIVHIPVPDTIADGTRNQHIGGLVLPLLQTYVKDIVTVSDDQIRAQMRFFVENMKIVVEPSGCLAAAAVMNRVIDTTNKRVGVIVSGGNVEVERLSRYISS